jgi:hypothetical protein
MRTLYRCVTVQYVAADNAQQARHVASKRIAFVAEDWKAYPVTHAYALPSDWRNEVPYSPDNEETRTCAEVVGQ